MGNENDVRLGHVLEAAQEAIELATGRLVVHGWCR